MTRRGDALDAKSTTINVLIGVVIMLSGVLIFTSYSLVSMRDNFTITIPPNIQNGAIVNVEEFNTSAVHAFASTTFRAVNRWEDDGFEDYGTRIEELAPRFTARFYEYLKADMNFKHEQGELSNRTRYALEMHASDTYDAHSGAVTVIDESTWIVNLSLTIVERISEFEVKNRDIQYPLVIRRGNIDPEKNPWGLLIDGYPEGQEPVLVEEYSSDIAG